MHFPASSLSRIFKAAFFCASLLPAIFLGAGQVAAEEEFVSREHGFKVLFPRTPTAEHSQKKSASGLIRNVRYRAKHRAFRTLLTVVTYSRDALNIDEVKKAPAGSRDRQVKNMRGELLSDTNIAIDGHTGKELLIAVGPPGISRIYR